MNKTICGTRAQPNAGSVWWRSTLESFSEVRRWSRASHTRVVRVLALTKTLAVHRGLCPYCSVPKHKRRPPCDSLANHNASNVPVGRPAGRCARLQLLDHPCTRSPTQGLECARLLPGATPIRIAVRVRQRTERVISPKRKGGTVDECLGLLAGSNGQAGGGGGVFLLMRHEGPTIEAMRKTSRTAKTRERIKLGGKCWKERSSPEVNIQTTNIRSGLVLAATVETRCVPNFTKITE